MEKVQDTHLNIGGLNWPVLINVEQVCRVMVDLNKFIDEYVKKYDYWFSV